MTHGSMTAAGNHATASRRCARFFDLGRHAHERYQGFSIFEPLHIAQVGQHLGRCGVAQPGNAGDQSSILCERWVAIDVRIDLPLQLFDAVFEPLHVALD